MDMPESCRTCDLRVIGSVNFCTGADCRKIDQMKIINEDIKPDWCPLKEFPEKKQEKYGLCRQNSSGSWDTYGEKVDSVAVGYNQCLDDICKLG